MVNLFAKKMQEHQITHRTSFTTKTIKRISFKIACDRSKLRLDEEQSHVSEVTCTAATLFSTIQQQQQPPL